ncbi:MAG TPA: EFR1 family ferrodoxin [Anaerolineae bacterium]|nr:EFR1 family ferrodoxin [Anaerolineae bacterium]
MKLLFLYFSGTGNTDYVAQYLAGRLAGNPALPSLEIEMRTIEQQPAETLEGFDLLVVGFPVYAADAPKFFQDYLDRLPPGDGRGSFVFCTKGAYAGGAVRRALQYLALKDYVPLGGGSVLMPGTDGLSLISKNSWMARKALEKDYDNLKDADRLIEEMVSVLVDLLDGQRAETRCLPLPVRTRASLPDQVWAALYHASENWTRKRLHADEGCEGCGLCVRICPVDNAELCDGHARFSDRCVLCLRCLHACPQEAIQIGKITVGTFRWRGPKGDFKPLRVQTNCSSHRQQPEG